MKGVKHMESAKTERAVRLYADTLYRTALSFCKNRSDAEDAVQNAFYKLLKTKEKFADDEHLRKWLIRVTINECKTIWRVLHRHEIISLDELELEHNDDRGEVFAEVMKLPENYRIAVYLYYYEGYACSEIASILGTTETNVQTRLLRARKKLREQLGEDWQ